MHVLFLIPTSFVLTLGLHGGLGSAVICAQSVGRSIIIMLG